MPGSGRAPRGIGLYHPGLRGSISLVRAMLSERATEGNAAALSAFRDRGGDTEDPDVRAVVSLLAEHAPGLLPLALSDVTVPADVIEAGLGQSVTVVRARDDVRNTGGDVVRALRRVRHRHVVRIALREILRLADVDRTSAEMAALASGCIEAALEAARGLVAERYGHARRADGLPMPLVCLGMGKLGGGELNLGSDIDLCFFYESDDGTVEGAPLAKDLVVHEYQAHVVSRASKLLSDVTEDGFCFRVDLRLRPEGSRGALVNSLASAERYYETFGRTWERAALLRARPVAGDLALGRELLDALGPFVFRRAVEPGVAKEMHEMVFRARRELNADEHDVKLGRGGIREAEFFVQTLQLVWGGRHPSLRVTGTIDALTRLEGAGLVSGQDARTLAESWALLRRVEHRVHAWTGYQTHRIPQEPDEKERFARSLGFGSSAELDEVLGRARGEVMRLFDSLLSERSGSSSAPHGTDLCDRIADGAGEEEIAAALPGVLNMADPLEAAHHLKRLARFPESPLGPLSRQKYRELGPRLIDEIAQAVDPERALAASAEFFGRLRRWDLGPLDREPRLLRRLIGLFGSSPMLSRALVGHPDEIELLLLAEPITEGVVDALHAPLAALVLAEDSERVVSAMRTAKREATLRTGLADVSGELQMAQVHAILSRVAERQVQTALDLAQREMTARFGPTAIGPTGERASMAVIALGKLGSRELGFGADLDLVFVFDDDGETGGTRPIGHVELFTRVAQRTMRLLSQPDAEGPGFATDTRLRPSGSQGTLVVSLDAFVRYHPADAWERQALTRARAVAGTEALMRRTDEAIRDVLTMARPIDRAHALELRARSQRELANEGPGRFHPKLGHGALVDVELIAQLLKLETLDPGLPRGTLDILAALGARGVLEKADVEVLTEGYLFFRAIEQTLRLLDEHGEPILRPHSRTGEHVARRLGLRARDGLPTIDVLESTYRRHAMRIRGIFERVIGPVDVRCPFGDEA